MTPLAVEAVHGDHEGKALGLEVVDRWKAVSQPPLVGHDDGTKGAVSEVIPHEPESLLPRCAKQVHDEVASDGDAAEIHGHGGRRFLLHPIERVDQLAAL